MEWCTAPIHSRRMCESHYRKVVTEEKKATPCACGCGQLALRQFVNGHNVRVLPAEEQARRGTFSGESRRGTGSGYVKYHGRHQHRVVAEQKLGRPLLPGEIVHHENRKKGDNSINNLEVTTRSAHIAEHRAEMVAALRAKRGA